MSRPARPGTRSPVLQMGLGGCYGPRSAIRLCCPHRMIRDGCLIASLMFNRIPLDKTRRRRRLTFRRSKLALALLLITVDSLGVAAAELAFDIKIERGRVADPMRLIRVNEGDVVKLRWT